MAESNFSLIMGLAGLSAAVFGIGYGVGQRKRTNDICQKIDRAVDEVASNARVDISDMIIRDAVTKAVDAEAEYAARRAVKRVKSDVESDIRDRVKAAVSLSHDNICKAVKNETVRQVAMIDIQSLKDEVVEQAKKDAAKKLDGCLDGILKDFNENLSNVKRIYQSISSQMFSNGSNGGKDINIQLL